MSLLQEYYDSIYQENLSKASANYASAFLTNQQGEQVAGNAAADRDLKAAQAGAAQQQGRLAGAQAQNVGQQGRLLGAQAGEADARAAALPGTAAAEAGLNNANAAQTRQATQIRGLDLPGSNLGTLGIGGGMPATSTVQTSIIGQDPNKLQGYEKGGTVKKEQPKNAVQGKGKPGPHDTIPVMMAPGEAVLNKGAVEHYGSDVVDKMNAMGMKRMGAQSEVAGQLGMPDPHAPPGKAKKGRSKPLSKEDLPRAAA